MAQKKEVYHVKPLTEGKKNIIAALMDEYHIETADDIQEALRDLLGGTIKSMMEAEMTDHLGYEKSARSDSDNARNAPRRKRSAATMVSLRSTSLRAETAVSIQKS